MFKMVGEFVFGLGLFLLGLGLLGDNLKKVGRARFRALVTSNLATRGKALVFGIISGAVMQSSSAALVILGFIAGAPRKI